MLVAVALEELHHGDVVVESGGGADDLVEVGGVVDHFDQSFVELLGGAEVMKRKDDGGLGSKFGQLRRFQAAGGLQLYVNQLTTGVGGFSQDFDFRGDGAFELASVGHPAAGGYGRPRADGSR